MNGKLLPVLVALSLAAPACGNKDETPAAPTATATATGTATAAKPARPPAKPGEVPFDYPATATTAKANDWVLAPPKGWIDGGFEKGGERQTFIFYGGRMLSPGAVESKIKTLPGDEMTIPNAMIVAIKSGQKAKVGDVVLTWWQSGSGMQRSIVVGGSDTAPVVRHLDMDLENPSGSAKKDDTLKPDTFHKLAGGLEPGTSVAAKDGSKQIHAIITSVSGDKVLTIGFAGKMKVYKKSDVTPIPIAAKVKPGAAVFVPHLGAYQKGKVDKVDEKICRVFTTITFGGKDKTIAVACTDVATSLPGM
jgi:hypothetical protein